MNSHTRNKDKEMLVNTICFPEEKPGSYSVLMQTLPCFWGEYKSVYCIERQDYIFHYEDPNNDSAAQTELYQYVKLKLLVATQTQTLTKKRCFPDHTTDTKLSCCSPSVKPGAVINNNDNPVPVRR